MFTCPNIRFFVVNFMVVVILVLSGIARRKKIKSEISLDDLIFKHRYLSILKISL